MLCSEIIWELDSLFADKEKKQHNFLFFFILPEKVRTMGQLVW